MKKVLSLIILMMSCAVAFAQEEEPNDSIQKPSKFASWTISDAFQAEAGFVGSYWKPTFNIALDKEGYYCVVNLYNQSGYYSVDNQTLPHLYLKTDKGEVVDLEMDGDEPIHKFYLKGYYSLNVWMPGRYVTRFIYYIPDIDKFLSNYYVKYKDYIKNVASSEIYSTWPEATIQANVLAIQSFTLNRVYTEWYRNKGYNFTITSSTAYDHKWIPGRNVFESISSVVDELFSNYLSRPNVTQPILTL